VVKLNRIYTRSGDAGQTGLADGSRVRKHDLRVAAYGDVDEANAAVGVASAACGGEHAGLRAVLVRIQNELFDVGADLATPRTPDEAEGAALRVTDAQVERLERLIDEFNGALEPLESFVLPGGGELAARLHMARTITRRAERSAYALLERDPERVGRTAAVYLNRLGDLLFVLARVANDNGGADVLWKPGEGRSGDEPESGGAEAD
jgi:cob(I)alamin adenosyltransferase